MFWPTDVFGDAKQPVLACCNFHGRSSAIYYTCDLRGGWTGPRALRPLPSKCVGDTFRPQRTGTSRMLSLSLSAPQCLLKCPQTPFDRTAVATMPPVAVICSLCATG